MLGGIERRSRDYVALARARTERRSNRELNSRRNEAEGDRAGFAQFNRDAVGGGLTRSLIEKSREHKAPGGRRIATKLIASSSFACRSSSSLVEKPSPRECITSIARGLKEISLSLSLVENPL